MRGGRPGPLAPGRPPVYMTFDIAALWSPRGRGDRTERAGRYGPPFVVSGGRSAMTTRTLGRDDTAMMTQIRDQRR